MDLPPTKEINIPPAFWKLHGKKAKAIDLILTYLLAVLVMLYNLVEAESFPVWKFILIAILSLDICGGVVSNFTDSTIAYYRNEGSSPHAFIWFHLLQSALLVCMFWEFRLEVIVVSIFAMLCSSVTIGLHSSHIQKQASVFFFALLFLLMQVFAKIPTTLYVLLGLLTFKMLLGFAAHWKSKVIKTKYP